MKVSQSCPFVTPWTVQSMEFSRPEYWSGQPFHSPGDLPNPGIGPRSPTLQADSLPVEPQGKPKNTGVGSLSILQGVFLTQELNRDLPHCKRILYQLSYQCLRDSLLTLHRLIQSQPPESSLRTQLGISCGSATLGHVNGAVTWSIFLKEQCLHGGQITDCSGTWLPLCFGSLHGFRTVF